VTRADSRPWPLGRPLLTLFTLAALAVLVTLGVWQVRRLEWKQNLLARIAALQTAPARPVAEVLAEQARGADVDYTRVVADCPGLEQAPFVRLYALEARETGFRFISACRLQGAPYAAVLVDRGFLPDARADRLTVGGPSPEHRAVVGVLRTPAERSVVAAADTPEQNLWQSRDAPAMARKLGVDGPVAPVFLFLESPPPVGFGPTPAPLPVEISNNHLGYAITWFGLAAALLGVYLAVMFKDRRGA
jgi:surfeit locus 1 family protein